MTPIFVKDQGQFVLVSLYSSGVRVTGLATADLHKHDIYKSDGSVAVSATMSLISAGNGVYQLGLAAGDLDTEGMLKAVLSGSAFDETEVDIQLTNRNISNLALQSDIAILSAKIGDQAALLSASLKDGTLPVKLVDATLSGVKALMDVNAAQLSAANSWGKLIADYLDSSVADVKTVVDGLATDMGLIKGAGFNTSLDALARIQSAVLQISTTSPTVNEIVAGVFGAAYGSYQAAGTMGEIMTFIRAYTTGERSYDSSTLQETMKDGVSTVIKTFDITLDSDGRVQKRTPL